MKTSEELSQQWNNCHGTGQILVDSSHPLRMFLNINNKGHKELLVPTPRDEKRFKSTAAIGVNNYKNQDNRYLAIELIQSSLETEYICLCNDLIESSRNYKSSTDSLKALFESFQKWYYLLADPRREILPEREIRGLIGEVQYILDELDSGMDEDTIIDAWKTHKDASRDFVFDATWSEIKTIEPSKDYVTISSLDQLEHDSLGRLIVYKLRRVGETDPCGLSLNNKIAEVRSRIGFQTEIIFNKKLLSKGYSWHEQYDNLLYTFDGRAVYQVDESFPCIQKSKLSAAIVRATYDIRISQIERWHIDGY